MINVTKVELPDIEEYKKYLKRIWDSSWVTNNGGILIELEKKLSSFLKCKNLLCVANGTLALQLPLSTLRLTGEVITTPFTFVATTNAIIWEGLVPVFADVDPETYNINPDCVEKLITKKTSAILAVHVYGNPCAVEKLEKIAKKHNIALIFDAAHAFAVEYKNRSIVTFGDISTLSFHATKVFNTIEGGAIVAKNSSIAKQLGEARNFGIISEEEVALPGINAKMNEFQAAMGLCNLETIKSKIAARKKLYQQYLKLLGQSQALKFQKIVASKYNYSYFPVCFASKKVRDKVHDALLKQEIKARKYFYPLTSSFAFSKKFKGANNLPVAKNLAQTVLCLPIYSTLTKSQVKFFCSIISSNCN